MITGLQVKQLRATLDYSLEDLANSTNIGRGTINNIEKSHHKADLEKLSRIEVFARSKGWVFINGGIQKKQPEIMRLNGSQGFKSFMDDVYYTIREQGGEICASNVDEANWIKWMGENEYYNHAGRMAVLTGYKFKILVKEGDINFIASSIAEYKWIKEEQFKETCLYSYGDKFAIINFSSESVDITIIEEPGAAEASVMLFNAAWEGARTPDA